MRPETRGPLHGSSRFRCCARPGPIVSFHSHGDWSTKAARIHAAIRLPNPGASLTMRRRRVSLFRFPWRSRRQIARDLEDELAFHFEMRVSELVANGRTPDDARRDALAEFGDVEQTRAYCRELDERSEREIRVLDRFAEWRQDLRYAWRTIGRSPSFAAVSLLTLVIAIGANTAIFTVTRAVLLRPLPYGSPASLVALYER